MSIRATIAAILGIPATLLILLNWVGFLAFVWKADRARSGGYSFALPFLCGPIAAFGWWLSPIDALRAHWWIATLLDPSITLSFVAMLAGLLKRRA